MSATLDLWDYRRRVHDMYRKVRERGPGPESWDQWVAERDDLFATHPQSPIEDRSGFDGLPYFAYDSDGGPRVGSPPVRTRSPSSVIPEMARPGSW